MDLIISAILLLLFGFIGGFIVGFFRGETKGRLDIIQEDIARCQGRIDSAFEDFWKQFDPNVK